MWGFTESQETVHVSPAMYEEFIFPYEKPIMDRFGLTCYGCCEPLHGRWHVVRRHHALRRVSCSPWVNVEKMAGYLGDKYIFSLKPNPAALAVPEIDGEAIRKGLREDLEKTRGCVVELIMKDNHTLAQRPENVVDVVPHRQGRNPSAVGTAISPLSLRERVRVRAFDPLVPQGEG